MEQREVEARLRALEDSSRDRSVVVGEFRESQKEIAYLKKENAVRVVQFGNLKEDLNEIKLDLKSSKNTIRSALITAAASIAVQLILFAILRSTGS